MLYEYEEVKRYSDGTTESEKCELIDDIKSSCCDYRLYKITKPDGTIYYEETEWDPDHWNGRGDRIKYIEASCLLEAKDKFLLSISHFLKKPIDQIIQEELDYFHHKNNWQTTRQDNKAKDTIEEEAEKIEYKADHRSNEDDTTSNVQDFLSLCPVLPFEEDTNTDTKPEHTAKYLEMKAEAINRMKSLNMYEYIVDDFEETEEPQVYEPPTGASYYLEDDELSYVRKLEAENDILIWGVIRCSMNYNRQPENVDCYLYVSNHKGWKQEREMLLNGTPQVITYMKSHDLRDYGTIYIQMSAGGTPLRVSRTII